MVLYISRYRCAEGTRYQVGDGKSVRMGIDNLVDSHPPRPLITISSDATESIHALILKRGSHRSWNKDKISQSIDPSDHNFLENIYLSKYETPDKLIWHYNPSGDYTVRSGYWFLTHDPTEIQNRPPAPCGSVELKNKIWKISIIPKIKHMIWRVVSGALPTRSNLATKGMQINT